MKKKPNPEGVAPEWARPVMPKEKVDPNVEMEESLYGDLFPKNDPHWNSFDGLKKRVHVNDLYRFRCDYGFCIVKKIYCRKHKLVTIYDGNFICKDVAEEGWEICNQTNLYYPKDKMVDAFSPDGNPMRVPQAIADKHFRLCDYSKKLIHRDYSYPVMKSERYRYVNYNLINDDYFGKCKSCGNVYESGMLHQRREFWPGGVRVCDDCYEKKLHAKVILKHDAACYPDALPDPGESMGYQIVDGLICSTMQKVLSVNDRMYGVEIETELSLMDALKANVNRFDIAKSLMATVGRHFIFIKEDGTLIANGKYNDDAHPYGRKYAGFEIVSAPAGIETHKLMWGRLLQDQYYGLLRSWVYDTCGLHIHVSKDAFLTDLTIARLLVFINNPDNRKFIWKVAGRSKTNFIAYSERKFADVNHWENIINPNADTERRKKRWVPLNLQNENTIELRIFRGTVNPRHIIRNIEFFDSLIDFCMPYQRSLKEASDFRCYVAFVDGNRKRWPLLAAWFAYHEILTLKKILRPERANLEMLTLKTNDIPEKELCA